MTINLRELFPGNENLQKKFVDALLKALKSNALKDFDYLKFKKSVVTMSELNMEEAMAFKSAFATASTMGLTLDKLVRSANHYKNVLDKEKMQFADAMQNQMDQRVAKKKEEAVKLEQTIKDYQQKIEQMQKEMKVYQKKINNVDVEIKKAKEKIQSASQHFMDAYNSMVSTIEEDILRMNEYL